MGSFFFILGALFGHYFLFPVTLGFLAGFGGPDMSFLPKIDEYWSFYSWFLLGLGLVFQIPVVIFVLARIGLVTPRLLLRGWKFAILALVHHLGVRHADAGRRQPDGAGGADDRPLPAGRARRVAVRQEAAGRVRVDRGQRGSAKLSEAPSTAFSRRACPAFISTT